MKLSFIDAEKASFPIAAMCRVIGVSRQAYHAARGRGPSARTRADEELQRRVREVFVASGERYGSPRVRHELRTMGERVSKRRVERAMRGQGLVARKRRAFRRSAATSAHHAAAKNVLNRQFTASRPNERWVADMTYMWTSEGWCYLAVVLDLYSRSVVGWAFDSERTASLPLRALENALRSRRPTKPLLHHSDRGSQYTCSTYREALDRAGIAVSVSRRGNCWDNAVAESFFATLKAELVRGPGWPSRSALRTAVFEYIESFYNRRRLHSSLNYMTPVEVESRYTLAEAA